MRICMLFIYTLKWICTVKYYIFLYIFIFKIEQNNLFLNLSVTGCFLISNNINIIYFKQIIY